MIELSLTNPSLFHAIINYCEQKDISFDLSNTGNGKSPTIKLFSIQAHQKIIRQFGDLQ